MNAAQIQRLLYDVVNRELNRISADESHAFYAAQDYCLQWIVEPDNEGSSSILLKFEDSNRGAQITIRNVTDANLPANGQEARSRCYAICNDLESGFSERSSNLQKLQEQALHTLADLWADSGRDFAIAFHPRTKFSEFWIQDFRKMPVRGISFSQAASKILGETRRTKSKLRGDGRSFTLEGITRQKIVKPISDPIARMRAIADFRSKALKAKISTDVIQSILDEAGL